MTPLDELIKEIAKGDLSLELRLVPARRRRPKPAKPIDSPTLFPEPSTELPIAPTPVEPAKQPPTLAAFSTDQIGEPFDGMEPFDPEALRPHERAIIRVLKYEGPQTARQIWKRVGVPAAIKQETLLGLHRLGYIVASRKRLDASHHRVLFQATDKPLPDED
jgi:hypothetical protein